MTESIRASSLTLSPAALAGYIANHAEILRESAAQLEAERDELQAEVARLRDKLADAPTQESEPKRLTVEDLDAAPVGSLFESSLGSRFAQKFTKEGNGSWRGDLNHSTYTAEHLTSIDYLAFTATLTPPESAHRGRVVKPEELREGDEYDVWYRDTFQSRQRHVSVGPLDAPGWEFRLISRKPPEPSEHPIIWVHRAIETYDEPALAYRIGDAWLTPDREKAFYEGSILDWSPARVVPAGQEGER